MDVTAGQWQQLWKVCDDISLWDWPESFGDRGKRRGLQYDLELDVGFKTLKLWSHLEYASYDFTGRVFRLRDALQSFAGWSRHS